MKKRKIMIVDDEEDIRYILRKFLEEEDYEVIEAKGGPQCLNMITKEKPDLVILDIIMPGLSRWDVCRIIKEQETTEEIPVSMLSVLSDHSDVTKSIKYAHADKHVSKPIDFPMLSKTIKELFKKYSKKPRRGPRPPKRPPGENNVNGFFVPLSSDSARFN